MLSSRSKKVKSLCAIIEIWQCSIHATHVTDCAVQHNIIVISRQSPCQISFVNLPNCDDEIKWDKSPCQISCVNSSDCDDEIKWDKFNIMLPGTFVSSAICSLSSFDFGNGWGQMYWYFLLRQLVQ